MKKNLLLLVLLTTLASAKSANQVDLVVAADGSGDFTTLTEAFQYLPYYNYQRYVILVKDGVYNEKIRIEKDFITIRGESREGTIIQYAQLREDWQKAKDVIGPAVINIHADDVILDNLTIKNTQPLVGPHAFTIFGSGTRTIITNCTVTSNGGDTVSLWNFKHGMYYHDNCYFEGAVDFVCPRGWCYISNSTFNELKRTAAVWHAAPHNKNQKFVMRNCRFTGVDSFYLARHHYDAQFYFLDCSFPELMQNKSIEHVVYKDKPEKTRPFLYGERYYFDNCHRKGGDYSWYDNNLKSIGIENEQITPQWTFDGKWNPLDTSHLKIIKKEVQEQSLFLWFDELVMPEGELVIQLASGKQVRYFNGGGWKRIELRSDKPLQASDLEGEVKLVSGNVKGVAATVLSRYLF